MGLVSHRFTVVWISLDVLCHHAPCLKDLKKVMATSKKTLVWKETLWPKKIRQRENKCEATLCTKQPWSMKMDYIYMLYVNAEYLFFGRVTDSNLPSLLGLEFCGDLRMAPVFWSWTAQKSGSRKIWVEGHPKSLQVDGWNWIWFNNQQWAFNRYKYWYWCNAGMMVG